MNSSTSKTNSKASNLKLVKNILQFVIPLIFWIGVWQIAAVIVDHKFLLPDVTETMRALFDLASDATFYKAIIYSAIRVLFGLMLGILAGIALAVLSNRFWIADVIITPIITVIKSTPVASFIVVLWVMLSGDALAVFVGFLMVMPIIWQNTRDGFSAIDPMLSEVADIFEFSYQKRFKLLIFPTLKQYLIPGIVTASGLAWKAEIAAEIIAYTKKSIGQGINDAKYEMDTPTVFAWTIIIIALSIVLEKTTKYLLRRSKI